MAGRDGDQSSACTSCCNQLNSAAGKAGLRSVGRSEEQDFPRLERGAALDRARFHCLRVCYFRVMLYEVSVFRAADLSPRRCPKCAARLAGVPPAEPLVQSASEETASDEWHVTSLILERSFSTACRRETLGSSEPPPFSWQALCPPVYSHTPDARMAMM
jgi:hypothetical protein